MGWLSDLFGRKKSAKIAGDRLKFVLMHDRADITPQMMQDLKRDIVEVISKYMEVDANGIDFNLSKDINVSAIEVSIPVRGMKRGSQVMAQRVRQNLG